MSTCHTEGRLSQSFRFDRMEVRPAERALLIDGKAVELGSRAFDLLQALITHRDRVVTKDELLDMVWPGLVVEENNLQAQVSSLRKLLGPKAIATIPGRGYQFVAAAQNLEVPPIIAAEAAAPPALSDAATPADNVTDETRPEANPRSTLLARMRQHKSRVAIIAGTAAVAISMAGYWTVHQSSNVDVKPSAPNTAVTSVPKHSIVVLPFTNLTGDPGQDYLADALTATMTDNLERLGGFVIVNTATAFTYKGKTASAQQVGRDLGVRFVLNGNVQRSGTRIRINAQLADANSNTQLWSESFDGDMSDLFALYDRVSVRIGHSIGPEMIIAQARDSETRKSNPKAVDLILRGLATNLKPRTLKLSQQREGLFREALALEPNNTDAMIALARALVFQPREFPGAFDKAVRQKKYLEARDLALKVKELDPKETGVYVVIGVYALAHDDFDGHRRAFETYLSLNPNAANAHNNLAVAYFYGGEPRRAIELSNQSIALDPRTSIAQRISHLCRAHFMLGDIDGTIRLCLQSLDSNPQNVNARAYLAMAYSVKGDDAKALAAIAELRKLPPGERPTEEFERPQPSFPTAYKEWYEKKFLPVARKVGLWE